ncbi:hypothetical protein CDD83_7598 [Cordyceps sp. RAO-2017]|nr:hypothetical protein CDD83_7598 [Cordyceps sp. RAO-2017]
MGRHRRKAGGRSCRHGEAGRPSWVAVLNHNSWQEAVNPSFSLSGSPRPERGPRGCRPEQDDVGSRARPGNLENAQSFLSASGQKTVGPVSAGTGQTRGVLPKERCDRDGEKAEDTMTAFFRLRGGGLISAPGRNRRLDLYSPVRHSTLRPSLSLPFSPNSFAAGAISAPAARWNSAPRRGTASERAVVRGRRNIGVESVLLLCRLETPFSWVPGDAIRPGGTRTHPASLLDRRDGAEWERASGPLEGRYPTMHRLIDQRLVRLSLNPTYDLRTFTSRCGMPAS